MTTPRFTPPQHPRPATRLALLLLGLALASPLPALAHNGPAGPGYGGYGGNAYGVRQSFEPQNHRRHGHGHGQHHRHWQGAAAALAVVGIAAAIASQHEPERRIYTAPPAVYLPPPSYAPAPPVAPSALWHYCASAGQYFPNVRYCPEGWQTVMPGGAW